MTDNVDEAVAALVAGPRRAKHSSESVEWYTPEKILEPAKTVLGPIHLDPASCALANLKIGAQRIYTEQDDGLKAPWRREGDGVQTVLLNPPGGWLKMDGTPWKQKGDGTRVSSAVRWWQALMGELLLGNIAHAIFIGFSIEILQTGQHPQIKGPLDFPTCVPNYRIPFDSPRGKSRSPAHANAIVYVPGAIDRTETFVHEFRRHGTIVVPFEFRKHMPNLLAPPEPKPAPEPQLDPLEFEDPNVPFHAAEPEPEDPFNV